MAEIEPGPSEEVIRYYLKVKSFNNKILKLKKKRETLNREDNVGKDEIDRQIENILEQQVQYGSEHLNLFRQYRAARPKPIYPISSKGINKRNEQRVENYFKWRGPTEANKSRKRSALNELKAMPPLGVFPGGTNFLKLKEEYEPNRPVLELPEYSLEEEKLGGGSRRRRRTRKRRQNKGDRRH